MKSLPPRRRGRSLRGGSIDQRIVALGGASLGHKLKHVVANLNHIAFPQLGAFAQQQVVEAGAVGRVDVLQPNVAALRRQTRVLA